MALNLSVPEAHDLRPKITVFGVGGAGGNAVNNMIAKELEGADFVAANTDAQALNQCAAQTKLQLGAQATQGLGAGARPEVGTAAAEESIEQIIDHLSGAHMCFITAGMGGGTGTGAAPIIAQAAREMGILTVGVVTKPFQFEGAKRMRQAEAGVEALQKVVDTLIVIPNQNLFRLANEKTTFTEAFAMADDVLYQGVKGVTDLMVRPGIINLDFADVRSVMDEMGKAMMGTGEASGEHRAVQAAEAAIANPLLDEISLKGARGVLINITGGADLTLFELDEAANRIREEVDADANIIVGSTLDESLQGTMRVSVVATGIDLAEGRKETPTRRPMSTPMARPQQIVEEPAPAEPAPEPVVARQPEPVAVFEPAPAPAPAPAPEPTVEVARYEQPAPARVEPTPQDIGGLFDHRPTPAPQPSERVEVMRTVTPSPEALRRLQAAVRHVPEPVEPAPAVETEREHHGRFAINNLINRMTGHGSKHPSAESRASARVEPHVHASPAEAQEEDQERIEIPAFLRRQAN